MGGHRPLRIVIILATILLFGVVLFFNYLAQDDLGRDWDIFESTTGNRSDKYYLELTPAGWTFVIWGAIYITQALFLIYGLTTICRRSDVGYLYFSPGYMSPTIYVIYSINLGTNVAWILLWDREYIAWSLLTLAMCAATLYIVIGISMYGIAKHGESLVKMGNRGDVIAVIAFIHNGVGMYATWTSIATLINGGVALTYTSIGLDQKLSTSIALGALFFELVFYAIVDMVLFERHFRFLFTPYLVLQVALVGNLWENFDNQESSNFIIVCALAASGGLLLITKIIRAVLKQNKDPLYTGKDPLIPTTQD